MDLDSYLKSKGNEYAPFCPDRAKNIYNKLKIHLQLPRTIIHIIGTNGKGSTGRFITLGLEQHNCKVLHFTSPHLFDFNERFYKNGSCVSDTQLEQAHAFLQQFDYIQEASYFEYATFLAFMLACDCEFLVLEAGLGGEFDSTNVVDSTLSVFTPISYDHQEILGESIQEIASTKLRAMSKCNVIAPQCFEEVNHIARTIAKERNASLVFVSEKINDNNLLKYAQKHHLAPFLTQNLNVAKHTLALLDKEIDFDRLSGFNLLARAWQLEPNILVDVGHNEACAREILKIIGKKQVNLVYNSFFQKDVVKILQILKPIIKKLLILDVVNDRILPKDQLIAICRELEIDWSDFRGVDADSEYVVFGSFSVVKEFLERKNAR
ncbi:Mur ligase family protein [uncultured Helicobacter sp.]|uniref:Mur ligase family protein n=1 Tax=uncultured Helicobacter sp. TaxID=175537 RepID=UPI0025885CD4|nr:Mur ligase family protein [uncultured Helicobacter sp.]